MLPFDHLRSTTVYPDAERLAGGNTPKRCDTLRAAMGLSWARVTVLFGDERCLPPLDPETNDQIANESLLRIACPATVHRIPGELGPDAAAAFYEPIVAAAPLDLVRTRSARRSRARYPPA